MYFAILMLVMATSHFPPKVESTAATTPVNRRSVGKDKDCASDIQVIDYLNLGLDDHVVNQKDEVEGEGEDGDEEKKPKPYKRRAKYNRHKIPGGGGLNVEVEVWVQDITTISDITSDFQLDVYISERWLDPALNFTETNPCKKNISLDNEILEKLWTPNLCFINSKSAQLHESPFKNFFVMVYPNGTVWTNYRLKLTGPCAMNLTKFPFDTNQCILTFESFTYNKEEVQMTWKDIPKPLYPLKKINLADYDLVALRPTNEAAIYPAGYWDELTMNFTFRRRYGWYILQAYLPTFLTIFISWISFALGTKAIPARTMLGVNSLLAMTFQFGNIIRNLPRVSYVKAIDVWMLSCMTFVFCSLLELAWVGYLCRDVNDTTKNRKRSDENVAPRSSRIAPEPRPPSGTGQYQTMTAAQHAAGVRKRRGRDTQIAMDNTLVMYPPTYNQSIPQNMYELSQFNRQQQPHPIHSIPQNATAPVFRAEKDRDGYEYRPPGVLPLNGSIKTPLLRNTPQYYGAVSQSQPPTKVCTCDCTPKQDMTYSQAGSQHLYELAATPVVNEPRVTYDYISESDNESLLYSTSSAVKPAPILAKKNLGRLAGAGRSSSHPRSRMENARLPATVQNLGTAFIQKMGNADRRNSGIRSEILALRIDLVSSFLFPSLFVLFNIVYWFTYLQQEEIEGEKE